MTSPIGSRCGRGTERYIKALGRPDILPHSKPSHSTQRTTFSPYTKLIKMPFWHQNRSHVERRHRLRAPAFQVDFRQTPTATSPESQKSAEKRRSKLKPDYFWDSPCPVWKMNTYAEPQATMAEEDPFGITEDPEHKAPDQHVASQPDLLNPNLQSPITLDYKCHSTWRETPL